jgi:hypothetical protein
MQERGTYSFTFVKKYPHVQHAEDKQQGDANMSISEKSDITAQEEFVQAPNGEYEDDDPDVLPFVEAENRLAALEARFCDLATLEEFEERLHEAEALIETHDGQFEEAFTEIEALEEKTNRVYMLEGQIELLSKQVRGLYFGLGACAMLWLLTVINAMHR